MTGMAIFWLVLLILFLLAEGATAAVTSIWFAAGALAGMLAAVFKAEVWLQVVLFITFSLILLLAFRPFMKKYVTPKMSKTNIDTLIGKQGVVLETINNLAGTGRIKLSGMDWKARSADDSVIAQGSVVRVEKIEGVKVLVTLVEAPVEIQ